MKSNGLLTSQNGDKQVRMIRTIKQLANTTGEIAQRGTIHSILVSPITMAAVIAIKVDETFDDTKKLMKGKKYTTSKTRIPVNLQKK